MMDGFDKPQNVELKEAMIFGGDMKKLLPPYETIPDEFKRAGKWADLADAWFFEGLPEGTEFIPRNGISRHAALRHLRAIMISFKLPHEHKTAGVAWLLSRWFKDVLIPVEREEGRTP